VPALAACYASERGLILTTVPLDYTAHRGDAVEWRDTRLVGDADAAVLVGDGACARGRLDAAVKRGLWVGVREELEAEPEPPRVAVPRFGNLSAATRSFGSRSESGDAASTFGTLKNHRWPWACGANAHTFPSAPAGTGTVLFDRFVLQDKPNR